MKKKKKKKLNLVKIIMLNLLGAAIVLLISVRNPYGLTTYEQLRTKNREQHDYLEKLQSEYDILDRRINLEKKHHAFMQEKIAREDLLMIGKDEMLYSFKPVSSVTESVITDSGMK